MGKNKREQKPASIVMSPADIIKHCASETVLVPVPGWGAGVCVPCRIPEPEKILELRISHADPTEFNKALFAASLQDFTADQLEQLKAGNGLKYLQLFNAVTSAADLFSTALSPENMGKSKPS